MKVKNLKDYRVRRHLRLRKKVKGSAERPRMSVFVSNKHAYVQFIDDDASRTLAAVSTLAGDLKGAKLNEESMKALGSAAAPPAQEKGIETVVFDRGGFVYSKRLRALAAAAREGGLNFANDSGSAAYCIGRTNANNNVTIRPWYSDFTIAARSTDVYGLAFNRDVTFCTDDERNVGRTITVNAKTRASASTTITVSGKGTLRVNNSCNNNALRHIVNNYSSRCNY